MKNAGDIIDELIAKCELNQVFATSKAFFRRKNQRHSFDSSWSKRSRRVLRSLPKRRPWVLSNGKCKSSYSFWQQHLDWRAIIGALDCDRIDQWGWKESCPITSRVLWTTRLQGRCGYSTKNSASALRLDQSSKCNSLHGSRHWWCHRIKLSLQCIVTKIKLTFQSFPSAVFLD